MATLTINGRKVTVDDSFKSLSPEQQEATVNEIAASFDKPKAPEQSMASRIGMGAYNALRSTNDAMSLGLWDRAAGAMLGTGHKAEADKTVKSQDDLGTAGTLATQVAGGLVPGLGAIKAGATAARFIPQGLEGGRRLAALGAAGAADGAALGAISGAAHTTDGNYAKKIIGTADNYFLDGGATLGGLVGAAAPVAVAGGSRLVGALLNKPAPVPTRADLKQQAGKAYDAAEAAGDIIPPQSMTALRDGVQSKFADAGFHPSLQPRAGVVMSELDRLADQPVTLKGLEVARRMAGKAYDPMNKDSNRLTAMARDAIDDVAANTKGGPALEEARALYARSAKADAIEQALAKANARASSTGSGGNTDNATRQEIRKMTERQRGLTPDEKDAAALAIEGSKGQNIARLIGKLSPEGNGLMSMFHGAGALASGGMSLPLMAVGYGAKRIADKATTKNVDRLRDLVLAGGDKSALAPIKGKSQKFIESNSDVIARLLMSGGIAAASQSPR
ncbi:MAG: hypothetical protein ACRC6I_18090 [Paracoccaceae bacterium]